MSHSSPKGGPTSISNLERHLGLHISILALSRYRNLPESGKRNFLEKTKLSPKQRTQATGHQQATTRPLKVMIWEFDVSPNKAGGFVETVAWN